MKNRFFRILTLAMLLALVVGAVPAMAATQVTIAKQEMYAGCTYEISLKNFNYESMEIVSVESSKPSVIKVNSIWNTSMQLKAKKVGKAVITVKYTDNGEEKTITRTFTVQKYPSAIKKLTINNKSVSVSKNRLEYYHLDNKTTKPVINLKPAKNWKISKIKAYKINEYNGKKATITVKNNKKFKLKKNEDAHVTYTLKNTKTGKTFKYTVRIERAGE